MLFFRSAAWWMPLGRDSCSSPSVVSIRVFNKPTDLLTLSAVFSARLVPLFLKKDFRKLLRCSRCRSRGTFFPFPPLLFQNRFQVTSCLTLRGHCCIDLYSQEESAVGIISVPVSLVNQSCHLVQPYQALPISLFHCIQHIE